MQNNNHLLLSSSTIFDNSTLIDNIHQSVIDLESNPPQNEIRRLLEDSISYIDKEIDLITTEEIFYLISSCLSHISNPKKEFYQNIYDTSQKNSNRLILFAIVFSHADTSFISSEIQSFISNISKQILTHIKSNQEQFKVFDLEINPKFKTNFIFDIIFMMKPSEKVISTFYSYILLQKDISKSRINQLFEKIESQKAIQLLSEEVLIDGRYTEFYSQEDLNMIIPKISNESFKEFLPLLDEIFPEEEDWDQDFFNPLFDRCVENNLDFQYVNDQIPFIFNLIEPSQIKPIHWNYFIKNEVILPDRITDEIKGFPKTSVVLKLWPEIKKIPINVLEKCLLEASDIEFFESLIDYNFSDKNTVIFSEQKFWIHAFSVISSSEQKYSDSLLDFLSKLFEKFVDKKFLYNFIESMIFENLPTTNNGNHFLSDLFNKFSSQYKEEFNKKSGNLISKIKAKKILPLPSFWKIFDYKFIQQIIKKERNDPMMIYAYYFTKCEDSKENFKKLEVQQLSSDLSKNLITEFIKCKDFDYLINMNEESLLFVISTLLYVDQTVKPEIIGLTKTTVLPFIAISFEHLNSNKLFSISKEVENLFIEACKYFSLTDMPLVIESIDIILSHYKYLFNPSFFSDEVSLEIFEFFFDQLINDNYKADKSILLNMIFNIQGKYSTNEKIKIIFDKYGIKLFKFILKNKSKIQNFERLKNVEFDLSIFDRSKITSISIDAFKNSSFFEDSVNTITFLYQYCKNAPNLNLMKSEKINLLFEKVIKRNNWNVFIEITNYMVQYNSYKYFLENLFSSPFMKKPIEELYIQTLLDQQFDLYFKILIVNPSILINYLTILFEKISFTYNIEPKTFLEQYSNEYKAYKNYFITALYKVFGYHPISNIFVRRAQYSVYNDYEKLGNMIFSKLFADAKKKNSDLKSLFILRNISLCFPFLFTGSNINKIFTTVLPALDSFSLYFTLQDDSDKEIVDKVKKSLLAFSFLISSLYSVKILDAFVPWVYSRIKKFTPSQTLSITFILVSLFNTEKACNAMLALTTKFNIIEVLVDLYQTKVPEEISSYYKANIYNILLNYYQMNSELRHQKDLIYVEGLQSKDAPFSYVFNNFLTIFPHEMNKIDLPESKNNDINNFIQNLKEIQPYSIHYKNQSVEINDQQIESFLNHYKKQDLNQSDELESINSMGPVKEIKYTMRNLISFCVEKYDNWIYQWLINLSKFAELPSHNRQLKDAIKYIGYRYDEYVNQNYDDVSKSNYYHSVYNQKYLFSFIIQKIVLNDDEDNLFFSLFNIIIQDDEALLSLIDNVSSFITHNAFDPENVKKIIFWYRERVISHKCFKSFMNIILHPEIRNDCNFFTEISEELFNEFENLCNELPKQCSILIGFLINFDQQEGNELAYMLSEYMKAEKLTNLKRITEFLFEKELAEDNPSQDRLIVYLKIAPSLIQTRKEMIPSLINKIISDYNDDDDDYDEHSKDKKNELICNLFNLITPERKEEKLVVTPNLDEIDFSLAQTSSRPSSSSSNSNQKQKIILQKPPISFIEIDPSFWKLYCEHIETLSRIIIENEEYLEKFQFLANFGELLLFEKRVVLFQKNMEKKINQNNIFYIEINRSTVLTDSFNLLCSKTREDWLSTFIVLFIDEFGSDAGGLTKEWFSLVSKEIFNPNFALFVPSETQSYQPNPSSGVNQEHIEYFKFIGKFIACALIHGQCVNAHFSRSFLRQILGRQLQLSDLEEYDESVYKSMMMILNEDVEPLCLTFTIDDNEYGDTKTVLLKEHGDEIDVTNENKIEYVSLYTNYRLRKSIINQITAFCEGFNWLISQDEIKMFSPNELDLLICGIPDIDVKDLEENTLYVEPYSHDHPVIKMFFNVISNWDPQKLAKFLLFLTGSSQVPVNGFKDYKDKNKAITIAPGGDRNRLCVAHTCFNTLDLPQYESEEELNNKLLISIQELEFGIA